MFDPDPTNMVDKIDVDGTELVFDKSIIKFHLIS